MQNIPIWKQIFTKRMLLCVTTGFSSGLPLYVLIQFIPAWLRDSNVELKTIGLFSLLMLPYTWKFIWAPLMDVPFLPLKKMGRRRSWGIVVQLMLLLLLGSLSLFSPTQDLNIIAIIALLISFFSASQDIVLDAFRREILPDEELGLGNSIFVNAYRLSSLIPGSLGLYLADHYPWSISHLVIASAMLLGILTSLFATEPPELSARSNDLKEIVIEPLREFFTRNGARHSVLILVFMLLYKLGDNMATALSTPFYLDMGFSKTDIASIVKVASLWSSIVGGMIGGIIMLKVGIQRSLWYFGVVQLLTILGFAWLAWDSHLLTFQANTPDMDLSILLSNIPMSTALPGLNIGDMSIYVSYGMSQSIYREMLDHELLFAIVSAEYLGVGLGTAAFVAFIAQSTNKAYTAAQLALLTSLSGLPRTFAAASTGYLIESMGYPVFFLFCTALAIPGMLLLFWVAPFWKNEATEGKKPSV